MSTTSERSSTLPTASHVLQELPWRWGVQGKIAYDFGTFGAELTGSYRSVDFYTTAQSIQITLNEAHSPRFGATGK